VIGAVVFSRSFAPVGKLVAGVEVAREDKWGCLMLGGQLQASVEERSLGLELWEIARQERYAPEPRKHQGAGALYGGRRALGHKGIQ
jgi:hypothetical protein